MALNRGLFNFEIAKQAGRGQPATTAAYMLKSTGGSMGGRRSIDELVVGDGTIWASPYTWLQRVESGGSVQTLAQPKSIGALVSAILGADSKSGGADPYTHTITPSNSVGANPWLTVFKRVDDLYESYPDCKLAELSIEANVDRKALIATATFLGAASPIMYSAGSKWTSASAESSAFNWNDAFGFWMVDGKVAHVPVDAVTAAPMRRVGVTGTDTATTPCVVLANRLKAAYATHIGDHATAPHGKANDTTNTIAAADATNISTCNTLLTEMKTDFEAHRILATSHYDIDSHHAVTATPGGTEAACVTLANDILDMYTRHIGVAASVREFSIRITRSMDRYFGQDVSAYDVIEGPGQIECSFGLLLDSTTTRRLYNRIVYGTANPTAGSSTLTGTIMTGSFYAGFDLFATNARSCTFLIPTVRYQAEDIMESVAGDPAGGAANITINGKASAATGDQITVVVKNDLSTAYWA